MEVRLEIEALTLRSGVVCQEFSRHINGKQAGQAFFHRRFQRLPVLRTDAAVKIRRRALRQSIRLVRQHAIDERDIRAILHGVIQRRKQALPLPEVRAVDAQKQPAVIRDQGIAHTALAQRDLHAGVEPQQVLAQGQMIGGIARKGLRQRGRIVQIHHRAPCQCTALRQAARLPRAKQQQHQKDCKQQKKENCRQKLPEFLFHLTQNLRYRKAEYVEFASATRHSASRTTMATHCSTGRGRRLLRRSASRRGSGVQPTIPTSSSGS